MIPVTWWSGWVALLLTLTISYGIARWAPEMVPVLVVAGPVAIALHFDRSPRRPIWAFRKDRA